MLAELILSFLFGFVLGSIVMYKYVFKKIKEKTSKFMGALFNECS